MQVGKINTTPIYSEFHMGELETWVNCLLKYSPTVIDLMWRRRIEVDTIAYNGAGSACAQGKTETN